VVTSNWTRGKQPVNTPPPQSITPGLHPVSIHQMAPAEHTSDCSSLLIYRPGKDERLSWPSWLTCSGQFTHITGQPVTCQMQVGRRDGKVSRPKTDVLPLCHATNTVIIFIPLPTTGSNGIVLSGCPLCLRLFIHLLSVRPLSMVHYHLFCFDTISLY